MFKDFIQSIYEKVYIINFDKCSQIQLIEIRCEQIDQESYTQ